MARSRAGCCTKILANWVGPLISYINAGNKLSLDSYGQLPKSEQVESQIEILEKGWNQKKNLGGNHILFKALLSSFKGQYFMLMAWNWLQTGMSVLSPFLIKFFIIFIQTGENALSDYVSFWDF